MGLAAPQGCCCSCCFSALRGTLWEALTSPLPPPAWVFSAFLFLARGKLRHVARLSLQDMGSAAEEAPEQSGSALRASGSQLPQAGQSGASEDNLCPICLAEISNAACVALCFHRFCFGCIQRWAVMRPVCPLCRRPFDRVLRVLPADDEEAEDRDGSPASRSRNVARERSRSRSPRRRYVLSRHTVGNRIPARRRRPVGSDRASRGDGAPVPTNTTSPQAPVPGASWARTPPTAGERVVGPGDGACVHIGTLALPPLRVQLSFRRAQ